MNLSKLSVATYKNVRFACNTTTTTVGRAKIKHEFANSNVNNIEDQGLIPRSFQLTALIFGENYEVSRDALLSAIEDGDSGVLIHPFYGRIENVVALPVTFTESITQLGRLEMPISFEVSGSTGIPSKTALTASGVTVLKDSWLTEIKNDLAGTFKVTDKFTGNFQAAQGALGDFVDTISESVTVTAALSSSSAEYRAKLDTFSRNINTLIKSPDRLAEGVTGLIGDITKLYETPEQVFSVAQRFFDFGDSAPAIISTTAGLAERRANSDSLNSAVQSSALAISYEAAAMIDYRTVGDVDTATRILESKYKELKG